MRQESSLQKDRRRERVRELVREGKTREEMVDILGVTRDTLNLDLRALGIRLRNPAKTRRKMKTRESASFKAETFARMRHHCASLGVSVAGWLDSVVNEQMDKEGAPRIEREVAIAERRERARARNETRVKRYTNGADFPALQEWPSR